MTHPIRSALLAAALALAPALAQAAVTDRDTKFLAEDGQGAVYELSLAQLAQQKATRPEVKAYADRLVSDHATQNAALEKLAASKGVPPAGGMKDADRARLDSMSKRSGPAFDAAFVKEAVRVNAEDKKAGKAEQSSTGDADIKAFLKQFASMDMEHEQAALALRGR